MTPIAWNGHFHPEWRACSQREGPAASGAKSTEGEDGKPFPPLAEPQEAGDPKYAQNPRGMGRNQAHSWGQEDPAREVQTRPRTPPASGAGEDLQLSRTVGKPEQRYGSVHLLERDVRKEKGFRI